MRRAVAVAAASLFLALSSTSLAAKGSGHGGGQGSSKSSGTKSAGGSQPVHVKDYTKKDGTHVEAHDRKAPEPKNESGTPTTHTPATYTPTPIRIYTDPVTGRKTLTNEPAAPLTSRPFPSAMTTPAPAARRLMTIAPSISAITASRNAASARPVLLGTPRHFTATGAARDANGRLARSEAAKHAFEAQSGYSHGRPGYVVDHIKSLACGGADAPSNMQWQTIAAAKAKDKTERVGCR